MLWHMSLKDNMLHFCWSWSWTMMVILKDLSVSSMRCVELLHNLYLVVTTYDRIWYFQKHILCWNLAKTSFNLWMSNVLLWFQSWQFFPAHLRQIRDSSPLCAHMSAFCFSPPLSCLRASSLYSTGLFSVHVVPHLYRFHCQCCSIHHCGFSLVLRGWIYCLFIISTFISVTTESSDLVVNIHHHCSSFCYIITTLSCSCLEATFQL